MGAVHEFELPALRVAVVVLLMLLVAALRSSPPSYDLSAVHWITRGGASTNATNSNMTNGATNVTQAHSVGRMRGRVQQQGATARASC